jgi:hypothetical protein
VLLAVLNGGIASSVVQKRDTLVDFGFTEAEVQKITDDHNAARRGPSPTASDMYQMVSADIIPRVRFSMPSIYDYYVRPFLNK